MKSYFFCALIILFCSTCKSQKKLYGYYRIDNNSSKSEIRLDTNFTFKYVSKAHLVNIFSEGRWWVQNDTLTLLSFEEITNENGYVKEETIPNQNFLEIKIFNMSGIPLSERKVLINEKDTLLSNSNGIIKYYKPIESIFIKPDKNYDFFYSLKNVNSNEISVFIDPVNSINKFFLRKKVLIKNRRLIYDGFIFHKINK